MSGSTPVTATGCRKACSLEHERVMLVEKRGTLAALELGTKGDLEIGGRCRDVQKLLHLLRRSSAREGRQNESHVLIQRSDGGLETEMIAPEGLQGRLETLHALGHHVGRRRRHRGR